MHPFVASAIVNQITQDRTQAARQARQARRRERRSGIRRSVAGR